jgi:cyanophycin synthetase
MDTHGVSIRSIRPLRGPNLYANFTVMYVEMDIGPYEERPSNTFPGFIERLLAWLPGLESHTCSVGRHGGFVERLRQGTYLAHITEHIALELQEQMGFPVSFGRARSTDEYGVYSVVFAYKEEVPARAAFETALRLVLAAMHDEPFDINSELEELKDLADRYRFGPSTNAIVEAARRRRIPVIRLGEGSSLVQLGYGIYQKRIQAAETSNTSSIAVNMCQEKALTNRMLRNVGVPVPDGRIVSSAQEAWEAAQEIGLPVVVKPEDGNQGKGVSVRLSNEADVHSAYAIASGFGNVLVERYIEGDDYRLLVINGSLVAAARRDPAHVLGDGLHSISELVEIVNKDPRRRPGHSSTLTRLSLDPVAKIVLAQQGLNSESIPAAGQVVRLRTNANLSTGGTATDVTDSVHPANARMAELAAQIMALDVAGIDVLCHDITLPLPEQGGAIVEVNAAPGLRMHIAPTEGQPRDVGGPIVESLYPNHAPSRIPIIAITGTNGKTTVTRLIAHMYETARKVVGMTSTEGIYIAGEQIVTGDCSGPQSARTVLLHPRVEVAVLETARGGILREGLTFDRCAVGVVTNISEDHLGLRGVNTIEELAKVKQVVIEAVDRDGAAVLNADDALVAEMAAACDGRVVYFSRQENNHIIAAHLASGGRAVMVQNGVITLADSTTRISLIELERLAWTAGGRIGFQVQNALAASAAAWAEGLNPAFIARALSTFTTSYSMVPGRFNISQINGVELILDYGHNRAALEAMGEAMAALEPRHTLLMITLPGDRRDDDLLATMEATRSFCHEYIIYDTAELRGRAVGTIPPLLGSQLPDYVPRLYAANQEEALALAWQRVRPGDRLILIADIVEDAIQLIERLSAALQEGTDCQTVPLREKTVG